MADDKKQIIPIPELDSEHGKCQLVLATYKSGRVLVSSASVEYAYQGGTRFDLLGDFNKRYAANPVRATQTAIDRQHDAVFAPVAVDQILTEMRAFYAAKASKVAKVA